MKYCLASPRRGRSCSPSFLNPVAREHDDVCQALRPSYDPFSVQSGEIYMRGVAAHVRPRRQDRYDAMVRRVLCSRSSLSVRVR